MPEFDHLRFDIERAIAGASVPTSKRARSEWAEHVSTKIAERLREKWELTRKPGLPMVVPSRWNIGPGGSR